MFVGVDESIARECLSMFGVVMAYVRLCVYVCVCVCVCVCPATK